MTNQQLSKKAVKGTFWVFALNLARRLLGLVRTLILARLLTPKDFGLVGVALLIISTLETFSNTGFNQALVQRKDSAEKYLNTAWTVQILRGLILSMVLFISAPYAAKFFKEPSAELVIKIFSLSLLFNGFRNIGIIYFQKELEFHKQFYYSLSIAITNLIVAIPLAFIIRNVWALVAGAIAGNVTGLVMSYIVHPYRPRFHFEVAKAKELYTFGRWIFASSILLFLLTQGDDILVGKLLGTTALGFYQMAYLISNMPATEITHVISQVTFPAYSKLQDNLPKLREAYLKVLQVTAFLSFPTAGLIFALAPDFTKIFLGEKWMPMVPAMQVLVLAGLVRSIAATAGPIFHALGKPQIDTKLQIVRLSVLAALIYPFTIKWGILGASIVVVLSIFVSNIGFCLNAIKMTQCSVKNFSKIIAFSLVNGIIMASFIFALKVNVNSVGIWKFLLFLVVSVFIYFGIIYLSDRHLDYGTISLIKESLNLLKGG